MAELETHFEKEKNIGLGFVVQRFPFGLNGIVVCALSSGYDPKNPCFQGVSKSLDFLEFKDFVWDWGEGRRPLAEFEGQSPDQRLAV